MKDTDLRRILTAAASQPTVQQFRIVALTEHHLRCAECLKKIKPHINPHSGELMQLCHCREIGFWQTTEMGPKFIPYAK